MVGNVLFDLDGTLSDPREGIVRSTLYALEKMGRELPEERSLDWIIGPPLQHSFRQILGTDDDAEVSRCLGYFRERFRDVGMFENALYPGIQEALSDLKATGCRLFVATSKPKVFADRIIEHFCLDVFFSGIYGCELDGTRIEKAEVIEHLLTSESIDPKTAIMVGDRMHDVLGANAHGFGCIGVLYGFGSEEELRAAGATRLCASPADLPKAIAGLGRNEFRAPSAELGVWC